MTRHDWLTFDLFAHRVGEPFELDVAGGSTLPVVLVDATEGAEPGGLGPDGQERLQFSLVFRGPGEPILPQGSYALVHEELGELELFLVPIGRDSEGVRYEAAFA